MAAKLKNKKTEEPKNSKSILARLDDGTIQVTLTIPFETVNKIRELVMSKMAGDVNLPGFRKGKAPTDLAMKQIDKQKVYDHTLQYLLPDFYAQAVNEHRLNPVLNPRFELINVEEDHDWIVRAVTCELPQITIGDYKAKIKDLKGSTREEKEQKVIESLLAQTQIKVPAPLIEEEVNHRLAQLIEQTQKLGLSIEQYLSSTGKKIEQIKHEYKKQAEESIKLVLALNKIAEVEKVEVDDKEIAEVAKVTGSAEKHDHEEEQKRLIRAVILRRKALDILVSLL